MRVECGGDVSGQHDARSFVDAAESAVIRADGTPVDIARFCADPRPPAQVCREGVFSADIFVAIVGFRYGSPVRGRPEVSYPELEFEAAIVADKPVLAFMLDNEMGVEVACSALGPTPGSWHFVEGCPTARSLRRQ